MKDRIRYTEKAIIAGLKQKNNRVIEFLYKSYFPSIENFVLKNSGKSMDAEDVFQDGLVIFYKKLVYEDLSLTCAVKTYVYAVCKNLWLQKLRKVEKISDVDPPDEEGVFFESSLPAEEEARFFLYKKHFLKLPEDCRKILTLFLQKTAMQEISETMKHSSVDYTKTRKYLCKKELIKRIKNDKEYRNLMDNG